MRGGVYYLSVATYIGSPFVEEADVGGGCAEEYVPDGSDESIVGWGRGNEISVL